MQFGLVLRAGWKMVTKRRVGVPGLQVITLVAVVAFGAEAAGRANNIVVNPLVWDAMTKKYSATTNDARHVFIFTVKNTGPHEITIRNVQPSCGCTIAKLPKTPWPLRPGEGGDVSAVVNFNEMTGTFSKQLTVDSTAGNQILNMELDVPVTEASMNRLKNREIAATDRQAVFKQDCAKCHVAPAIGKMGEELYQAACAICHDSPRRAASVPALNDLNKKTYPTYWRYWIGNGGKMMMPAFSEAKGGFLTDAQIDSLVPYLDKKFPSPAVIKPFEAK